MLSYILENLIERANFDWIVIWYGNGVFGAHLMTCQPDVAARLPGDRIAEIIQDFAQLTAGEVSGNLMHRIRPHL